MPKDYYGILGAERNADTDTLKQAYRKLALEWHPDKHQGTGKEKEAEEKFKEISEAYAVLSDQEKRRNYDATGSPDGSPFSRRPGGFYTTGDPFEMFRKHFGGLHGMEFGPRRPRVMKGQNVQEGIEVSLKDSLFGGKKRLEYQVISSCSKCDGAGATEFKTCAVCSGAGGITQQDGNMIMHQTCGACGGQGRVPEEICDQCEGKGIVPQVKRFNVAIPKGISNGKTLRLAGEGGRGFHGGPPGDLLLAVRVKYPNLSKLTEKERGQLERLLSK